MEKEVFILTKEELEERDRKVIAKCAEQVEYAFKMHNTWQAIDLHTEPVPLPSPVKVPSEERYKNTQHASENTDYYNGYEAGYNQCLTDLKLK